ncbi:MAG: signal peptidase I [Microthrixaceae bacterium]
MRTPDASEDLVEAFVERVDAEPLRPSTPEPVPEPQRRRNQRSDGPRPTVARRAPELDEDEIPRPAAGATPARRVALRAFVFVHTVLEGVGTFVVVVTVLAAFMALVPPLVLGWKAVVVESGSMQPRIRPGDIVIAERDGRSVPVGAVGVFRTAWDGRIETHRVVAHRQGQYTTKGDANASPDSTPIPERDMIGRGRVLLRGVGIPVMWIHQGNWLSLAALLAVLGISLHFTRSFVVGSRLVARLSRSAREDP